MKPHKHAELIRAWADGATIQCKEHQAKVPWEDCPCPWWSDEYDWRVKPAEPEKSYPRCKMTWQELHDAWQPKSAPDEEGYTWNSDVAENIANAALRHACDTGQIVTREEFDRAVGDRAKRDMAIAKAVGRAVSGNGFHPHPDHLRSIIKGVTQ